MGVLDITLECVLVVLLGITLLHAVRLERALKVLRGERAALGDAVAHLESGTRQAESGVEQLRAAAENAGRQLARQVERAVALQDDLRFLHARGESLADRLDAAIRAGRGAAPQPAAPEPEPPEMPQRVRSQAERDLLRALQVAR
jgi:Domain of unknown function (DUF6468)